VKQRRTVVLRPVARPNSDINVTPLVDVVLVMLIIFMVVTPLLEKDIVVRVPPTEKVEDTREVPPDQILVRVDDHGEISVNAQPVTAGKYVDHLRGLLASKQKKDRVVFFMADDRARYGRLVTVLDGAKAAGAETLGMTTEEGE
jgi:biopolymer transport protein ExbD